MGSRAKRVSIGEDVTGMGVLTSTLSCSGRYWIPVTGAPVFIVTFGHRPSASLIPPTSVSIPSGNDITSATDHPLTSPSMPLFRGSSSFSSS